MQTIPPAAALPLRVAGSAALVLGLAVLCGWALDIGTLKVVLPGLQSMKANTALCFALCGTSMLALAAAPRPAALLAVRACAGMVAAVAGLTLLEYLFELDLGLDEMLFQDRELTAAAYNGRMSVATALAFSAAALALLAMPLAAASRPWSRVAHLGSGMVLLIGAFSVVGYLVSLDLLYSWRAFSSVALHTGLGFTLVGGGLYMAGQAGLWQVQPRSDQERITRLAAFILVLVTLSAGIAGFAFVRANLAANLSDALQLALQAQVLRIASNTDLRTTSAQIITTRPNLLRQIRSLHNVPQDEASLAAATEVLDSFLSHGFGGIRVYGKDGRLLASAGQVHENLDFDLPLATAAETHIVGSAGKLALRHRLSIADRDGPLGHIVSEQPLAYTSNALLASQQWKTAEFLLCKPQPERIVCLPTRQHPDPIVMERDRPSSAGLVEYAARGVTGTSITTDYRRQRVMGAYAPIPSLGLVAVLKVETNELYRPVAEQLRWALPMILLLAAAGTLALRKRVRPLAGALEQRVGERTAELERANQRIARREAQVRKVLQAMPNALVVADGNGRIVELNAGLETMFGYTRDQLIGQAVEMLIPEPHRAVHLSHRAGYLAEPHPRPMGADIDLRALHRDGHEFPVEIGLAPVPAEDGSTLVLASIIDITERQAARLQLEAALQEKTVLLNEVHHRVKNNLTVISSLLNLQAGSSTDPAVQAVLDEAQGRVKTMSLIHQL
ncbi:MAG: PAS domain S-box protein, partial [Rhodocyclaceae bacterium]|nr:PAS domain S-box protein [Rhodocyclaceae bacterium]